MPGSGAIEALRVTGGIQYSIILNKWCSLGLFIACPEWGKWWRIGFLCRASFLIQMKSQEVHSSHFGDNEVVKLLVLCGHQELHLCTRRVLCLRRPGWHRYIIIVVLSLHAKSLCVSGEKLIVLSCYSTLEWKSTIKDAQPVIVRGFCSHHLSIGRIFTAHRFKGLAKLTFYKCLFLDV